MSNRARHLIWASLFACAAVLPATSAAAEKDARGIEFFESKIRPVLVKHCYQCHSAQAPKVRGGLVVDTRQGLLKGGDNGPAMVPGYPKKSLLIAALKHDGLKMPPKEKLSDTVVADFTRWVEMGAPDPRQQTGSIVKRLGIAQVREHWAYRAIQKPAAPQVHDNAWPRTDIDRFVLAKMEAKGLSPVADADRRVLIRRLTFDLTGLPPTPEEIDAFLADRSTDAVEKLVDRLLKSPAFGERWGRHWLDVVRYADSNGNVDDTPFPNAWRYRNYVIDAFNKDKPYDRFVSEQVAGDLLPARTAAERDEHLVATGFLALTSKPRAQNNPNYQMDLIADQIDATTKGFLGLTAMCARCHDHKFDPIPTKEYYALAGIFDSTDMLAGAGGRGAKKKKGSKGGQSLTLSNGGQAMGVRDSRPTDCEICIKGDSRRRGETAPRGFLTAATLGKAPAITRSQSGRLELAKWLTAADNPLTARVMANRVWAHLFGRGIVPTVDNFGVLGEEPSHPELLDHLATRFVEDGWSVKRLIRAIALSRTYQLSSVHNQKDYKVDPDNVLLWRMNPRRLEAEAIRDTILAVSGQLDRTPPKGGVVTATAGKKPKKQRAVASTGPKDRCRTVYLAVIRTAPHEFHRLFDAPDASLVVGQRDVTTVPAQALFFMNSSFVADQSRHLARGLLVAPNLDDAGRIDLAYRLALGRLPSTSERSRALAFVAKSGKKDQPAAWAPFCQALFACAEFRYVD
jgi:Protein of unknown function (DUF1553)/Protein of unknown function (DUF1549)/Planctomycete cytochrome C